MSDIIHNLRSLLTHCRALDRPVIEQAIAEIEQARADAARFRLLTETTDSDAVDGLYAAADVIAFKYQVPIKRIQELIAADTAVGWIALIDAALAERRE